MPDTILIVASEDAKLKAFLKKMGHQLLISDDGMDLAEQVAGQIVDRVAHNHRPKARSSPPGNAMDALAHPLGTARQHRPRTELSERVQHLWCICVESWPRESAFGNSDGARDVLSDEAEDPASADDVMTGAIVR